MGTKSPQKVGNDVPGPGAYQSATRPGRAASISGKLPTKTENYSPGPGAYDHKSYINKKGIIIAGKIKQEGM